jgi:BASS family bile acid:Na+ symporter
MAIAPGAPFLLTNVRKRGGSLGLAVALAFFLPLISIVTVPLTAQFVLPAEAAARLPIGQFFVTLLLFQLLPLLAGIVVGDRLPAMAPKLAKLSHLLFLVSVLALLILLGPKLVADVVSVYGSHGMWAMLCIVLLSLAIGWVLGGRVREDRRVLAMGTALRNIGLCALIATTSFRDMPVAATVLTYFLIQFFVVNIVAVYFSRTAAPEAA